MRPTATHISASLLGASGVLAGIAVAQMAAPTWLLWVTVVAFLIAATLVEFATGKLRAFGVIGITVAYLSVATPVLITLRQLDGRRELMAALTDFAAEGASLKQRCSTTPPSEFETLGNRWLSFGVALLEGTGRTNDARRLRDGEPLLGMPQLAAANCAPESANNKAAYGIAFRLVLVDDLLRRLEQEGTQ